MVSIPKTYLPNSLSKNDKKIQRRELKKSRNNYKKGKYVTRKKIKSFTSTVSPHIIKAMKMYNVNTITSSKELSKATKCSREGLEKIISKGRGAYYSSGSRPNQTAESWGRARLGSAITGGKSAKVDYHILKDHCHKNSRALKLAKKYKKSIKLDPNKKTQLGGSSEIIPKEINFKGYPDFKPNLTPRQMFLLGSFGGTYWRPIHSSITNKNYKNQHLKFKKWWKGIPDENLTSSKYDDSKNKYKVSCGLSLEEWESYGWITSVDPYGWVQWYCNFTNGRRHKKEDKRQIDRWKKFASRDQGRFRKNLVTKILKNNGNFNDETISPKIRQGLQHWGYQLTKKDFDYEVNNRNNKFE